MDDIKANLSDLLAKVDKTKAVGLDAANREVEAKLQELEEVTTTANDEYTALQYLLSEFTKELKADKNHARYVKNKNTERFMGGGFGKQLSKSVVERLSDKSSWIVREEFDRLRICVWQGDAEPEAGPRKQLRDLVTGAKEALTEKATALKASLAKNSDWAGALSKVDMGEGSVDLGGLSVGVVLGGNCPWMMTSRMWAWRYGPKHAPLPGVAAVYYNLSEKVSVALLANPVDDMLAQGIAAADMAAFLETPSGATYFAEKTEIVVLTPRSACWMPFGLLVVPVPFADLDCKMSDEQRKNAMAEVGCLLHIPMLCVDLGKEMSSQSWASVEALNTCHLDKHKANKLWGPRHAAWKEFAENLSREMST